MTITDNTNTTIKKVASTFYESFRSIPHVFRSPGRINLIGEHTDYNMGFVLPAAIDKAVYIGIEKRNDSRITLRSIDFNQTLNFDVSSISKTNEAWANYILGVVDQLLKRGYNLSGFNMVISGDIPIGAGLSSSAAIACAVAFALDNLFNLGLSRLEMAQIAQKAEHEFAGVMCGIMDQFASLFGRKNHLIKLDCRSLKFEYVPMMMNDIEIVLLDTTVKHSLASSEYNVRRRQCESGVEMIRKKYNQVNSLRDITIEMIKECIISNSDIYKRCRYVVEENNRLLSACDDLKKNNFTAFGKKMFETHDGLKNLFDVSCPELDCLVEEAKNENAVLGSRMMGGGFGGCTINLVRKENVDEVIERLSQRYKKQFGLNLTAYKVTVTDGTSQIDITNL
ncbi:MAG: galactokinase [Bacteroidia bacterium]